MNSAVCISQLPGHFSKLLLAAAFQQGFRWGGTHTQEITENFTLSFQYERDEKKVWIGDIGGTRQVVEYPDGVKQVVEFLLDPPIPSRYCELNDEYSAEVTSEGIKVGCQTFSFATFDRLAEVVGTIREQIQQKGTK